MVLCGFLMVFPLFSHGFRTFPVDFSRSFQPVSADTVAPPPWGATGAARWVALGRPEVDKMQARWSGDHPTIDGSKALKLL